MNSTINNHSKLEYIKPAIKVVYCRPANIICGSTPETRDTVSSRPSYSRSYSDWDEDEE